VDSIGRGRRWTGAVFTTSGVLAAVASGTIGHRSGNVALAAISAALVLTGVIMLGPIAAGPAVRIIGRPVARVRGLIGTLARENAARQPRRTSGTAAALLVGVTVVALFTVIAASMKASLSHAVKQSVAGDLVIGGSGFGGTELSPQLASDVSRLPQVERAAGLGENAALIDGSSRMLTLLDPSQAAGLINLHTVTGSLASLQGDQLAASKSLADSHHWRTGSTVAVVWPDGSRGRLSIGAIYQPSPLVQSLVVPATTYAAHNPQALTSVIFVKLHPGADVAAAERAVNRVAATYGQPTVQTRAQYESTAASGVNTILGLIYVMLGLSIIIALLGIANTLALSIHERARELGLLRAIGQTRKQTRSMVRWESVIVAVFGTIGGLVTGLLLGWALVRTASSTTLSVFAAPAGQMIIILVVGGAAGVLAAVRPARRAAGLDVLTAIAAE
jgi:putative ABC transport system permease protein